MRDGAIPGFEHPECRSGFHRRPASHLEVPRLSELIMALRAVERDRLVGMVVGCCCGQPSRAIVAKCDGSIVPMPPALPPRLMMWVAGATKPSVLPVASLLQPWLALTSALVVPMATPAWRLGALIASATPETICHLPALKALAADFALRFEEADRRCSTSASPGCNSLRLKAVNE